MKTEADEAEAEQAERREYVRNIGIEYRFGCLEEKRSDSCQLLGDYLEAIEQNAKAAFATYKDNCLIRKNPMSCYKYATYVLSAKECDPKQEQVLGPLEVSCDGGHLARGCRLLGICHWNNWPDKPANSQLAERYMKQACDKEDAEACWLLSTWYMGRDAKLKVARASSSGEERRTKVGSLTRDMKRSLEYGIRACDLQLIQSCANVSRMYKLGDGIPRDPDKAKHFHDRAKEIADSMKKRSDLGLTG